MSVAPHILGDWGTTTCRLMLVRGGDVLDRAEAPGLNAASEAPAKVFSRLTEPWRAAHGPMPVTLCGMAGARGGWREAGYTDCPAELRLLGAGALRFWHESCPVSIIPGLRCTNPLGAPDVMRGEETQIAGAVGLAGITVETVILPGTHTKWARVDSGAVHSFLTAPTGEVFATLCAHAIIARAANGFAADDTAKHAAFLSGVKHLRDCGGDSLLLTLFETRARQLVDGMPHEAALGFLSGLLIGAEIAGAMRHFPGDTYVLVGNRALCGLYAAALDGFGKRTQSLDGEQAVRAGLHALRDPV